MKVRDGIFGLFQGVNNNNGKALGSIVHNSVARFPRNCRLPPAEVQLAAPASVIARPLLPLTLALAAGIAASAWGIKLSANALTLAVITLFLTLVFLFLTKRNARLVPLALFFFLGLALARQALNPAFPSHHVVNLPQEQWVTLKGHLYRPCQKTDGGVRLFLAVTDWLGPSGWRAVAGKVLLVGGPGTPQPSEGAEVVVRTRLKEFRDPLNPGAFPRSRYWAAQEIYRQGSLKEPADLLVLAPHESPGLRERLREGFRRLLAPLDQLSRALYLALILGDQGEVSREMRQAFGRTGTSHLLAISGLHLGALAGLGFGGAFWLLRRFPRVLLWINAIKLASALAAIPVVAYAWIAGGSPATARAEIMILAYLLLILAGRPREVLSALALAGLFILIASPLLLFSLSFQLSFISVAALAYLLPRWVRPPDSEGLPRNPARRWGRRLLFWGRGALFASVVATLATAPLVAASFHTVSVVGVGVNLLAIPLINGVAVPAGLLALAAQAVHFPALAQGFLKLGQIPIRLAYTAISWGAALPGSALILPTPSWLQILLFYGVLFLIFPPRRSAATCIAGALAGVLLAGTIMTPYLNRPSDICELTCLDSHTGLAGLLVTPSGRRLVISAGWPDWPGQEGRAGGGALPEYLHWRQFRRLDQLMALSLTSRNAPELLRLAREFRPGQVWLAGGRPGPEVIELRNFLGDQGRPARSLTRGGPPKALGEVSLAYDELANGRSVALRIIFVGRQVLLLPPAGLKDLESLLAASGAPLEALVAPTEPELRWLAALRPGHVIVYGAPGGRFRSKRRFAPSNLYYTQEGAVTLQLSGKGAVIRQFPD